MDAHKVDHGPALLPIPPGALNVAVCFAVNDPEEFTELALGAMLAGGRVRADKFGRVARWTGGGIVDGGVAYTVVGPLEGMVA